MFRIYVGNLNYRTTEDTIRQTFAQYGQVSNVSIVLDRETGRPRGFAFVEMADPAEGQAAIEAMHGAELEGRALTVNEARPREPRGTFGGQGGGYRGNAGYSAGQPTAPASSGYSNARTGGYASRRQADE